MLPQQRAAGGAAPPAHVTPTQPCCRASSGSQLTQSTQKQRKSGCSRAPCSPRASRAQRHIASCSLECHFLQQPAAQQGCCIASRAQRTCTTSLLQPCNASLPCSQSHLRACKLTACTITTSPCMSLGGTAACHGQLQCTCQDDASMRLSTATCAAMAAVLQPTPSAAVSRALRTALLPRPHTQLHGRHPRQAGLNTCALARIVC
jgi:hypothetical protein